MTKRIALNHGKYALVDDQDYESIGGYHWGAMPQLGGHYYAYRNVRVGSKWQIVFMHRVLVECPDGMEIDHKNGNTLDNRRCNLRVCAHKENMRNRRVPRSYHGHTPSSRYKGVSWRKAAQRWTAQIGVDGHLRFLGYFVSEHDAARAYNAAALEHFGEFARLNVIDEAARNRGLWPEREGAA